MNDFYYMHIVFSFRTQDTPHFYLLVFYTQLIKVSFKFLHVKLREMLFFSTIIHPDIKCNRRLDNQFILLKINKLGTKLNYNEKLFHIF